MIVAELVAAGIEGGSKRQVEEHWGLPDYREQLAYWKRTPPPHISLMMIAEAHGAKFEAFDEPPDGVVPEYADAPPVRLSIAEIAARMKPVGDLAGDALVGASREALRLMAEA